MKTRSMVIASAAAVTMLAAGCSSGSGNGAAKLPLEKTSIVVDAFPAIDSAGLYIAQMDGLFAAQGLNVTIVPAGKGDGQIAAILKDAYASGYRGFLCLEPHLAAAEQFSGFSGPRLFKVAADALKKLCREIGVPLESRLS